MLLTELKVLPDKLDISFSQAVKEFVEKHGLKAFHGGQATVIAKDNHVWRAWFRDLGYEKFLEYVLANSNNPHLPKVLSKVRSQTISVKSMKDLNLKFVKLEKLSEIGGGNSLTDAMDTLSAADLPAEKVPKTTKELIDLLPSLKIPNYIDADVEDLQEAIKENELFFKTVLDLLKNHKANDFSIENVMMRGNVPVITDPISMN